METKEQSKIQKLMKSKPAKAGVSVALVGTLALAGIGAYFTGTDTVENKFDISAGLTDKITVVEENWDTTDADTNGIPDAAEHVVPLQTIAFPVFEQLAEGDGYVWEPVTGEIDNAKWKAPSPNPDDDAALMTYCGAEGSVLTETVTAHAVQAKNFEPDFEAASPWGDVEVEGTDVSASKEAR